MFVKYFKLLTVYTMFCASLLHAQSDSSNIVPSATLLPTLQISSPEKHNVSDIKSSSGESANSAAADLDSQNADSPEENHQMIDEPLSEAKLTNNKNIKLDEIKIPPKNNTANDVKHILNSNESTENNEIKVLPKKDTVSDEKKHTPNNNEGDSVSHHTEIKETKILPTKVEEDQIKDTPNNIQDERKTIDETNEGTVNEPNPSNKSIEEMHANTDVPIKTLLPEETKQLTTRPTTKNNSEVEQDFSLNRPLNKTRPTIKSNTEVEQDLSLNIPLNKTVNETSSTERTDTGHNSDNTNTSSYIKLVGNDTGVQDKIDHNSTFGEASHKNATLTDGNDVKTPVNNSSDAIRQPSLNHAAELPVANDKKPQYIDPLNSTPQGVLEESTFATEHVSSTTEEKTISKMITSAFLHTSHRGLTTLGAELKTTSASNNGLDVTSGGFGPTSTVEQTTAPTQATTMPIHKRIRTPPVNPPESVKSTTQSTTTTTVKASIARVSSTLKPSKPTVTDLHLDESFTSSLNKTENFWEKVLNSAKQLMPGQIAAIICVVLFALALFLCCLCRCRKRRKYARLRKLRQYGQENDFLLTDRKAKGKYQSDRMTLLDDSSEDEL